MEVSMLSLRTVVALSALHVFCLGLVLPMVMGRGISESARAAQKSFVAQAFSWLAVFVSGIPKLVWFDWLMSTLCMALAALSALYLYRAVGGWLGPRPLRRTLFALSVALPVGYALLFPMYVARVAWANGALMLIFGVMAWACVGPQKSAGRRWRYLLMAALAMSAAAFGARMLLVLVAPESFSSFWSTHPVNVLALVVVSVNTILQAVAVLVAWQRESAARLRSLAVTDGLTSLLNRRGMEARAHTLLAFARRHRSPLVAMIIDIDFFKKVNDTHGHDVGDRALKLLARLMQERAREVDVVARLGGEEFCVLLPGADVDAAQRFYDRLRAVVAEASVAQLGFELNFSAGVAQYSRLDADLDALLRRADAALYAAKNAGRGRLVGAEQPSGLAPLGS
jgi:diguanylate cyclase (GGDEF)-like protein